MSVRQRLYPDPVQRAGLVEHCHHARFVFNIGLEQRSMWRRSKHDRPVHPEFGELSIGRITTASQMRELAALRRELDWLRAGSSSVQQAALRDLDRACANFFAGRAKYPVFKRRTDREGSFVVRDVTVHRLNRRWATVMVPKVGRVRFRLTRAWATVLAASSARVTHRNGHWHVSFTTTPPTKIERTPGTTGGGVGVDRGVANTLAFSTGHMESIPALTTGEQARFVALQQRLARQVKGSRRRARTLDSLAGLRRRLDARRTEFIESVTTTLARAYDLVAVEDLKITNMVRRPAPQPDPDQPGVFLANRATAKAALNKAIHASCWGKFATRLEQKMPTGHVVKVDPRNTSRTCAACGHCAPRNRESQAVFECQACGHAAHADTNAALNILHRARPHEASPPAPGHGAAGRIRPTTHVGSVNQPTA